jgi:hypothetical protein
MSKNRSAHPEKPNWTVDVKMPPTALWLPVATEQPLWEISRKIAIKIFGADKPEEDLEKFANVVALHTDDCRKRHVRKGGIVFFPDFTRLPPVATVDIFRYYSEDPKQPTSLQRYRELYGTPDKETVGSIDTSDINLPAGPAVRFHNRYWPKIHLPVTTASQHETITYAVCPPDIDDAVVLAVAWAEFRFSEMLINMADAIAQTLEIKIRDA